MADVINYTEAVKKYCVCSKCGKPVYIKQAQLTDPELEGVSTSVDMSLLAWQFMWRCSNPKCEHSSDRGEGSNPLPPYWVTTSFKYKGTSKRG